MSLGRLSFFLSGSANIKLIAFLTWEWGNDGFFWVFSQFPGAGPAVWSLKGPVALQPPSKIFTEVLWEVNSVRIFQTSKYFYKVCVLIYWHLLKICYFVKCISGD